MSVVVMGCMEMGTNTPVYALYNGVDADAARRR
jgi:hypothetical protein